MRLNCLCHPWTPYSGAGSATKRSQRQFCRRKSPQMMRETEAVQGCQGGAVPALSLPLPHLLLRACIPWVLTIGARTSSSSQGWMAFPRAQAVPPFSASSSVGSSLPRTGPHTLGSGRAIAQPHLLYSQSNSSLGAQSQLAATTPVLPCFCFSSSHGEPRGQLGLTRGL